MCHICRPHPPMRYLVTLWITPLPPNVSHVLNGPLYTSTNIGNPNTDQSCKGLRSSLGNPIILKTFSATKCMIIQGVGGRRVGGD
jgi:hypothetical protein